MPYVGIDVTSLCEQVLNGCNITSNNTVCQPILWKKFSLRSRKSGKCVLQFLSSAWKYLKSKV